MKCPLGMGASRGNWENRKRKGSKHFLQTVFLYIKQPPIKRLEFNNLNNVLYNVVYHWQCCLNDEHSNIRTSINVFHIASIKGLHWLEYYYIDDVILIIYSQNPKSKSLRIIVRYLGFSWEFLVYIFWVNLYLFIFELCEGF